MTIAVKILNAIILLTACAMIAAGSIILGVYGYE